MSPKSMKTIDYKLSLSQFYFSRQPRYKITFLDPLCIITVRKIRCNACTNWVHLICWTAKRMIVYQDGVVLQCMHDECLKKLFENFSKCYFPTIKCEHKNRCRHNVMKIISKLMKRSGTYARAWYFPSSQRWT